MIESSTVLNDLSQVIASRKANPDGDKSYVASLLTKGLDKINAKVLEEAEEVTEAARESSAAGKEHLVREVADLVFHSLVLLGHHDLNWQNVEIELRRRFGVGGHQEKASRPTLKPEPQAQAQDAKNPAHPDQTAKASVAANVQGPPPPCATAETDGGGESEEGSAFLSVLVPREQSKDSRVGAHDVHVDPVSLVYVETQWIRYEAKSVLELMDLDRDAKNLSGSLMLKWPDPKLIDVCPLDPETTIKKIKDIFDIIKRVTPTQVARMHASDGDFTGLLTYSSGHQASSALLELRDRLRQNGMGVREIIHDLLAPRED